MNRSPNFIANRIAKQVVIEHVLFRVGAAFYRASGNSSFPMKISILSNIINVIGSVCFIYGLKWSVAGAAFATLFARSNSYGFSNMWCFRVV